MFTLRQISSEGVEMNQFLGEKYTYIDRWRCPEAFERCWVEYYSIPIKNYDPESQDADKIIFGFVRNNHFIEPLFANQKTYIMSESGRAFANIAYWHDK